MGSPVTQRARPQGRGTAKWSQLPNRQGRFSPKPTGTTGKPARADRYTNPACTRRRGPRGPSGVIARWVSRPARNICRIASMPPRLVEPRIVGIFSCRHVSASNCPSLERLMSTWKSDRAYRPIGMSKYSCHMA